MLLVFDLVLGFGAMKETISVVNRVVWSVLRQVPKQNARGYGMLHMDTASSTISSPAEKYQAGEPPLNVAGFIR